MTYEMLKTKVRMERDYYKEMYEGERDDKVKAMYKGISGELHYILRWCERMEKENGKEGDK